VNSSTVRSGVAFRYSAESRFATTKEASAFAPQKARNNPTVAPAKESSRLSVKSCRASRARPAPSARRPLFPFASSRSVKVESRDVGARNQKKNRNRRDQQKKRLFCPAAQTSKSFLSREQSHCGFVGRLQKRLVNDLIAEHEASRSLRLRKRDSRATRPTMLATSFFLVRPPPSQPTCSASTCESGNTNPETCRCHRGEATIRDADNREGEHH